MQRMLKVDRLPARAPCLCTEAREFCCPRQSSRDFARAAMYSNSFTVVTRVATDNIIQDGPARIVSFSTDPFNRNFDLGQEGRQLFFRVRTPVSGANGNRYRTETPPILQAGKETLIVASYDGAVARIYLDGQLCGRSNLAAAGCRIGSMRFRSADDLGGAWRIHGYRCACCLPMAKSLAEAGRCASFRCRCAGSAATAFDCRSAYLNSAMDAVDGISWCRRDCICGDRDRGIAQGRFEHMFRHPKKQRKRSFESLRIDYRCILSFWLKLNIFIES